VPELSSADAHEFMVLQGGAELVLALQEANVSPQWVIDQVGGNPALLGSLSSSNHPVAQVMLGFWIVAWLVEVALVLVFSGCSFWLQWSCHLVHLPPGAGRIGVGQTSCGRSCPCTSFVQTVPSGSEEWSGDVFEM
jgi:hypothetical protein